MLRRDEVEAEMREVLGDVPALFKYIPDELLGAEWDLTKRLQFGESMIPNRYKELIGVAVAAATRCPYGILLHRELAAAHGATEAEIAEAVHLASLVSALSVQHTGLEIDRDAYATEVHRAAVHIAGNNND
jgi:AhpD family alkylhydroperoxidase